MLSWGKCKVLMECLRKKKKMNDTVQRGHLCLPTLSMSLAWMIWMVSMNSESAACLSPRIKQSSLRSSTGRVTATGLSWVFW